MPCGRIKGNGECVCEGGRERGERKRVNEKQREREREKEREKEKTKRDLKSLIYHSGT